MGRDDAQPPDRMAPPPQSGQVAGAIRVDEARAVASIAVLIVERRQLRVRPSPITPMSAEDKDRVVAIDAELDQLWAALRRARSPMRHVPAPTTFPAR